MGIPTTENSMNIRELMTLAIQNGASDLHINPGRPPVARIDGQLVSLTRDDVDDDMAEQVARDLCEEKYWLELNEVGSTDFGLAHESGDRFRVNVFRQRGRYTAVLRVIPQKLLSMDEIGLPPQVVELLRRPRGLILVTGPTGSGKTTTLATLVNWINQEYDKHIITIEDPIEYFHPHGRGLVSQRELGTDVPNFTEAMRRALRQDPDVILLGEMRDLETIQAAITAAETGHLVFGTLHTTGSARTVNRIIDAYPANQQEQIRAQLSVALVAVISQLLLPRKMGQGRLAAFELMIVNAAISNLIRKNETAKIQSTLQTSRREGMITLDDYLLELVRKDIITRDVALDASQNRRELEARL